MIFQKQQHDLDFVDSSRSIYQTLPVKLAREVSPSCVETQKALQGSLKFAQCPGMIDYAQLGYIIPAWVDMHIIANKAGTRGLIGSPGRGNHGFLIPRKMDPNIFEGVFETQDGVPLEALNFSSPWKIFVRKNISAMIMPAIYHSTFLDDLYVFAGVVDYQHFHTVNFIVAAKRECEIHIKAGDPVLQVIPFLNDKLKAGYGPGTDEQIDSTTNEILTGESQYYRKHMRVPKIFKLFGKG
jgi:hypothetical protein